MFILVAAVGLMALLVTATMLRRWLPADVFEFNYFAVLLTLWLGGYQIGQIFYRDWRYALVSALLFSYGMRYYHSWQRRRKARQLKEDFLELNRMLLSELHAGKSLDQAYRALYDRICRQDQHYQVDMKVELQQWCQKLDMGIPLTAILSDFSTRCQDEQISQFVSMIEVAKRSGTSLIDVIAFTDRLIGEARQIERELNVLIAEKKLEQLLLSLSPIGLLYIMQQFSYDFVAPLYETAFGRILMTLALFVFSGTFIWSKRMTEIDL